MTKLANSNSVTISISTTTFPSHPNHAFSDTNLIYYSRVDFQSFVIMSSQWAGCNARCQAGCIFLTGVILPSHNPGAPWPSINKPATQKSDEFTGQSTVPVVPKLTLYAKVAQQTLRPILKLPLGAYSYVYWSAYFATIIALFEGTSWYLFLVAQDREGLLPICSPPKKLLLTNMD